MHAEPDNAERQWCIVLAEDSEQDARFFRKLLESSPDIQFDLHCCSTPDQALALVEQHPVDVLFLDFALTEPDDFAAIQRISQNAPHLPILIMTGVDNQHLGVRAIQKGAQDYLVSGTVSATNIWRIIRYAAARKRTQDSLVRHLEKGGAGEDQFRMLVDETPEAILVVNADGVIQYANPAAERCLKQTRGELRHAPSPVRIAPDQLADRDIMIDGAPRTLEVQAVSAQWQRHPAQVVTLRDVTHERRRQREREAEDPDAQRAQAAESLACLAGGIAHDYRNLLMGILGNASLALMEIDQDSVAREYLDHIREAARKASDLTNKMLTYSGRNRLRLATVDLRRLVDEMKPVIEPSSPTNVNLVYALPEELPLVLADADHLRQALMNLLLNAWEAMDDEPGTVTIRAGISPVGDVDAPAVSFLADDKTDEPLIWIEVEDTGPGIPRDLRRRVFDPFFSTKFAGRGLGLSTVQGVIRGHAGAITVGENPDGGARIRLFLPARRPADRKPAAAPSTPLAPAEEWMGEGRILVVDDEPVVLDICRRYLSAHGFEVVTANDGREAVDIFQAEHRDIRAVILDLNMPNMNGREALRHMKAIDPSVGVIISTGFAADDIRDEFEGMGIAGLLEKPYEPAPLLKTLHDALDA